MNYKCVFADLDRTLLNRDGGISDYTRNIIERLLAKGIDFVPCSGRSLFSLPDFFFKINGLKHSITSNGVSVDDLQSKKSLSALCIPEEIPEKIMDFLKDESVIYECFVDGQGYTLKSYYDDPLSFGCRTFNIQYIKTKRIPVEDTAAFALKNRGRIGSFDIIIHPEDTLRIFAALKEKFPDVYMVNSETFLVEVSNKDCGKHMGLARYCRLFGIRPEETVAFGDGNNDVEMLSAAGLSVAVANACEKCLEVADRVCESFDNDGVAKECARIFGLE